MDNSPKKRPGLRPMPAQKQILFGRWEVKREISKGGFGKTFEVKHLDSPENNPFYGVAKVILDKHKNSEEYDAFLNRFSREVKILAHLNKPEGHTNICKIYEADLSASTPYFVMERYQGNTIFEHVKQYGAEDESNWFRIAEQILSGLTFAHSKKTLHGDLNPNNIIIDSKGAKLIDFGLSKIESQNSLTTALFGAHGWTAPEWGSGPRDYPSDVFVAATILVFLGTGRINTFPQKSEQSIQHAISHNQPNYAGLTTNQRLLLQGMHEKDPKKRITASNALEKLNTLRGSGQAKPILGKTPVPANKAQVPAKPKKETRQSVISKVGNATTDNRKTWRPGLLLGTIFTGGFFLLAYWLMSKWKRTKDLGYDIKFPIAMSLTLHLVGWGVISPLITIWWARRLGFKRYQIILPVQLLLGIWIFTVIAEESNTNSVSGEGWLLRLATFALGFYVVVRDLRYLSQQDSPADKQNKLKALNIKQKRLEKKFGALVNAEFETFTDWKDVTAFFVKILGSVKDRKFLINLETDKIKGIFFQGYSEPDSAKTIEAAADLSVIPKLTDEQKLNMTLIGWELPSQGLPNFIMFLDLEESDDETIAQVLSRTLKDGYGIELKSISSASIKLKG